MITASALAVILGLGAPSIASASTDCPTSIAFGATISCSIASPGQTNTYTFTAAAGDKVLARISRLYAAELAPGIRIHGPDGPLLCENSATTTAEIPSCTLTRSGVHSLVIYAASNGAATGEYLLFVQRLNKPGLQVSISFGQTISGYLDSSRGPLVGTYTFTAAAGDAAMVKLSQGQVGGNLYPVLRLYAPDGSKLCEDVSYTGEIGNCALTSTGTHLLLVSNDYPPVLSSAGYFIHLQRLNNPAPSAPAGPPFGTVDSPKEGASGLTGAIAITGWALDDTGVTMVTIMRDPVDSEQVPPGTKLIVGSGVFVPGARPDVAAAYPLYPLNSRAGWGYQLLTNMLPKQGNGTYTLYVYAYDANSTGNSTLLGTRTITCSNATAIKPFGTLDTPAQGEAISGSAYVNFGWALTPQPKVIPTDGSTITSYIDGAPIGRPVYNQYRSDIATLFPGLNNSNGAVGALYIDTTKYPDGLHTLSWSVFDSDGVGEGIGSRYITVQNGSSAGAGAESADARMVSPETLLKSTVWSTAPIFVRRGYSEDTSFARINADRYGIRSLAHCAMDRLELRFEASAGANGKVRFEGYEIVAGQLRALPIGSRLEPVTGAFTWQPAIGFAGQFNLLFLAVEPGGETHRIPVRIHLENR